MQATGAAHRYGATALVEPTKIWKVDTRRTKVAATIEPDGDVGAPALRRSQWMLTGVHLLTIEGPVPRCHARAREWLS